ncbi:MAG: glycosyltransferase family 2 protein [Gemmatimonadaceae bacterium]|jgi:glycosyltransferase involved in cell wall biosynthesis|nr:glycosyltransferase family 2 protein [Gemmatimonadaceae bacterium]
MVTHPPSDTLRTTLARVAAGMCVGVRPSPADVAALARAEDRADVLVAAALWTSGVELARMLLTDTEQRTREACVAAIAERWSSVAEMIGRAARATGLTPAECAADWFGRETVPAEQWDAVAHELDAQAGEVDQLDAWADDAMCQHHWSLARRLLLRVQHSRGADTPTAVYARLATCLHRLGQFETAEAVARMGWGDHARALAVGAVFTEGALLGRWHGADEPLVSVVCTTFNHARYIATALEGFLSQDTPFPFEILVHDDASTDGTADIVRAWQSRYPTIIRATLQTDNQFSRGVRPFELLLRHARGRYVAVCEGDDWWVAPDKLRRQVEFLEANPAFSCTAHNYYLYTESTLAVRPWIRTREQRVLTARQLKGMARLLWLPTLVFRRTFDTLPPERALSPIGDQFLTSFLGTFGPCCYFEGFLGAVRRENAYSSWSPLDEVSKERIRVRTWIALVQLHTRLGDATAVHDLTQKIAGSTLPPAEVDALIRAHGADASAVSLSQAA